MSFFRRLSHSVKGEPSGSVGAASSQGQDTRSPAPVRTHDPSLRLVAETDVSPSTQAHYMPGEGSASSISNGTSASTAPIDIPGSGSNGLGSAGSAYQPHFALTSGRSGPARRASEYTPSPVPIRIRDQAGPPADNVPIPSYEMATSAPSTSATLPRRMSIGPDAAPVVGDYFGASPRTRYEVPLRTGSVGNEAVIDDEDDPLVPRARRQPPALNLRPLRRNTLATITALGDLPSSAPVRSTALASAIAESDTETETEQSHSTPADAHGSSHSPSVDSLVPPPISPDQPHIPATIDLPAPPVNSLPAYSATLQQDELRLISTVHLDPTHPSASFFSALTNSHVTSGPVAPADPQVEHDVTCETGGKKLRLTIAKGGRRTNGNGTGPMYIKMKRGGTIQGTLELGKVDHAVALEVAIIGYCSTSYYVRGQYTLIDTMPYVRRVVKLFPNPQLIDNVISETSPDGSNATDTSTRLTTSFAIPFMVPVEGVIQSPPSARTRAEAGSNGPINGNGTLAGDTSGIEASQPGLTFYSASGAPLPPVRSKDGTQTYIPPGAVLPFSITMPSLHYRDDTVQLPPTCQIYQVGMQASVEYVLRVKLQRKGWRMNESLTVPIIYEPRPYISPRRLRALTSDDPLNPGWRTIRLHGGESKVKPPAPAATDDSTAGPSPPQPTPPGIEVSLLMPSPPILYVAKDQAPPPIPFHLHFHSPAADTHALSTFSDPSKSLFVIRLMRVATMKIGNDRELRRMEVPSHVEVWHEGGERIVVGEDRLPGQAGFQVSSPTASNATTAGSSAPAPLGTAANGDQPNGSPTAATGSTAPAGTSSSTGSRPLVTPMPKERKTSFLRRMSSSQPSSSTASASASSTATTTASGPGAALRRHISNSISHNTASGNATTVPEEPETSGSAAPPLAVGSTDVHMMGEIKIAPKFGGTDILRRLLPSFSTPEVAIAYVVEVGVQPRKGSIKENFTHVWGGGLVEVVVG